ncbi:phosphotransferase family [Pyrenophora seminiperda CCB06]|uniref:Phosphotransferase family n=1 Tax=Pyrenophora seminiperda CCB06 TaxID=1302712 RepID=A0A3M7M166_9PLEO|nr:phosphotransferase family [Pyrenophora seminiperda CCB06]
MQYSVPTTTHTSSLPTTSLTSSIMTRTVYLLIYSSPLFPAHWALWIPSLHDPTIGKRLHVEGDASNGFEIAFIRNYVLDVTSRPHQSLPLAEVADHHVLDVNGDGSPSSDSIAHDDLERVLLSVPAPGASLVSSSSQGPRKRVQIQNCQTWLSDAVAALVEHGIMNQSALQIIDNAPKN